MSKAEPEFYFWGSALAVHALTLVGSGTFLGPEWEQRKIAKYLGEATFTMHTDAEANLARPR